MCSADLGGPPRLDERGYPRPPSLRLEVGPRGDQGCAWRLSTFAADGTPEPLEHSDDFHDHRVDSTYRLCGEGHIFLESWRYGIEQVDDLRITSYNMVAAIGSVASGKSFLMARALKQSLIHPEVAMNERPALRRIEPDPLEAVPLLALEEAYDTFRSEQQPLQPNTLGQDDPQDVLDGVIRNRVLVGVATVHTKLMGQYAPEPRRWARRMRQPVVMLTRYETRRDGSRAVWTGVADVAGELFGHESGHNGDVLRVQALLKYYDALVWVVDPAVVGERIDAFLEGVDLAPSLRPASVTDREKLRKARVLRSTEQTTLAQRLAYNLGLLVGPHSVRLQVAVSKCDLLLAALHRGRTLTDLGPEVRVGAALYLKEMTRRAVEERILAAPDTRKLVDYLWAGGPENDGVRTARCGQVADELLAHFSRPEEFAGLVTAGHQTKVEVPSGDGAGCRRIDLSIPAVGRYLNASLTHGSADLLWLRDAVLSAVGCGVVFGLGLGDHVAAILQEEHRDLRFFLCSPFGAVPVPLPGDPSKITRSTADLFPPAGERSAAETQLLLAILRRARP